MHKEPDGYCSSKGASNPDLFCSSSRGIDLAVCLRLSLLLDNMECSWDNQQELTKQPEQEGKSQFRAGEVFTVVDASHQLHRLDTFWRANLRHHPMYWSLTFWTIFNEKEIHILQSGPSVLGWGQIAIFSRCIIWSQLSNVSLMKLIVRLEMRHV